MTLLPKPQHNQHPTARLVSRPHLPNMTDRPRFTESSRRTDRHGTRESRPQTVTRRHSPSHTMAPPSELHRDGLPSHGPTDRHGDDTPGRDAVTPRHPQPSRRAAGRDFRLSVVTSRSTAQRSSPQRQITRARHSTGHNHCLMPATFRLFSPLLKTPYTTLLSHLETNGA